LIFISVDIVTLSIIFTVSEPIKVSNEGYVVYDMAGLESSRSEADMIILRFRTTLQDGVLLYADGNQGDYIAIELKRGYLHFKIDLGML
jgi:contactin associated protein-like 2